MKNFKEMTKMYDNVTNSRILCPNCGHSVIFSKFDKTVCSWCKHYVFKNEKAEFEYRLKESINRNK